MGRAMADVVLRDRQWRRAPQLGLVELSIAAQKSARVSECAANWI